MMNKNDFVKKIIAGFPKHFKNLDIEVEKEKYFLALETDLDFDKLYELFLKDWKYSKTAPQPAYFQKFFPQCRNPLRLLNMPSERRAALVKVANWVNTQKYIDCLYRKEKAPYDIREAYRKYRFDEDEIDALRVSGELGRSEEWN